jgi:hypothetical protein
MNSDDKTLIGFKAVCNFVSDLSSEYGKRHKPLKLYSRLLSKTRITNDEIIQKHLDKFREFCVKNREALLAQDRTKITSTKLEYSDRVFIDMKFIFELADEETTPVIWRHLLTISAILDPSGNAREVLKNQPPPPIEIDDEFFDKIISKVEGIVKPGANPMEILASVMQTGVLNDFITGIQSNVQSGKFDLKKLMGSINRLVTRMKIDDNPEAKKAVEAMTGVLTSIANGQQPDLAGIMSTIMSMMSNLNMQQDAPASSPTTASITL